MTAGEKYQVLIEQILPIGAIVRMPDGTTELIHISQIANTFVDKVDNFVSLGQQYEAQVVEGQGKKPLQLSLKHLGLKNPNARPKSDRPRKDRTPRGDNDEAPHKNRYNSYKKPPVKHPSQTDYAKVGRASSFEDMLKKAQAAYEDKTRRKDAFKESPKRRRKG